MTDNIYVQQILFSRPGKIEISESPTKTEKKPRLSSSPEETVERKRPLRSPPSKPKTFFSKAPLAKRAFKQAVLIKNATKAASSLKNKYSNLAQNRRAKLNASSSSAGKPASPKSENEDATPIGDQLESLFGKPEDSSDAKEDTVDEKESETEEIEDEQDDTQDYAPVKGQEDSGGEDGTVDQIEGQTEEKGDQLEKVDEDDTTEKALIKVIPDPVHESDPDEEICATRTNLVQEEPKELDAKSDTCVPDIVPKPSQDADKDDTEQAFSEIQGEEEYQSDTEIVETEKEGTETAQNNSVDDNQNDSNIGDNASKDLDSLDSSIEESVAGDKVYHTESDSDLTVLRNFSMALNDATEDEDVAETKGSQEKEDTENQNGTEASMLHDNDKDGERQESSRGVVTPKKNPFLENLVESCKAKLGVSPEELVSLSHSFVSVRVFI